MPYTVYNLKTHVIVARHSNSRQLLHLKRGHDWIEGDFDDALYRVDPETGVPYPFIDQPHLLILIRRYAKSLREKAGVRDIPALLTARELGTITPAQYDAKLAKRRAIDACHDALIKMKPIPQDYNNPEYWKCK